jgi:hypothetical protein
MSDKPKHCFKCASTKITLHGNEIGRWNYECEECFERGDFEGKNSEEEARKAWNDRTPGPATKAMLELLSNKDVQIHHPFRIVLRETIQAFLAEWPDEP